tara:strand:- start:107 stop:772 length:666 start_codon:yes stop_codon:yes gene_type:complete
MNLYRNLKVWNNRKKEKIDQYHEHAHLLGAKILGESKKNNHLSYLMSCGHIEEKRPYKMKELTKDTKNYGYSCQACWLNRLVDNYVYILRLSHPFCNWIKLGYSKDIGERINFLKEGDIYSSSLDIGYGWTEEVELENIWHMGFQTENEAWGYEDFLHNKYEDYKMNKDYMKTLHTKNGSTECYPDFLWETLIEELTMKNYNWNWIYHGNLQKKLPVIYNY